jgi:cytochrome c1
MSRSCDNNLDTLKAQHAAAVIANETATAKLEGAAAAKDVSLQDARAQHAARAAAHAAAIDKVEKLTAENAAPAAAALSTKQQVAYWHAYASCTSVTQYIPRWTFPTWRGCCLRRRGCAFSAPISNFVTARRS